MEYLEADQVNFKAVMLCLSCSASGNPDSLAILNLSQSSLNLLVCFSVGHLSGFYTETQGKSTCGKRVNESCSKVLGRARGSLCTNQPSPVVSLRTRTLSTCQALIFVLSLKTSNLFLKQKRILRLRLSLATHWFPHLERM